MEAPEVVPYEAMLGGPHRPMLDIVQLGVAASPPAAFGGLRINRPRLARYLGGRLTAMPRVVRPPWTERRANQL